MLSQLSRVELYSGFFFLMVGVEFSVKNNLREKFCIILRREKKGDLKSDESEARADNFSSQNVRIQKRSLGKFSEGSKVFRNRNPSHFLLSIHWKSAAWWLGLDQSWLIPGAPEPTFPALLFWMLFVEPFADHFH